MGKKLSGNNGISIEIVTNQIKNEINKHKVPRRDKKERKPPKEMGKLRTSDWKTISFGISILKEIIMEGFDIKARELQLGEKDISKIQKEIVGYRSVINNLLRRIARGAHTEYYFSKDISKLEEQARIIQAARDGVLLKQEERKEIIDGKEKTIIYDTSMTPNEVVKILDRYYRESDEMLINKLNNYLGLGLGIAGTVGSVITSKNNNQVRKNISLMTVTTTAVGILRVLSTVLEVQNREEEQKLSNKRFELENDLLENETLSSSDQKNKIQNIKSIAKKEKQKKNQIDNRVEASNLIINLAVALISGMYVNKQIQIKENGKIDGKSLAAALIQLQNTRSIAVDFVDAIQSVMDSRTQREDYEKNCEKLRLILKQMEEKVYPLEGAEHSFDSIEIKQLTGKFFPKKDYETGEIHYSTIIEIPEFSMKRGDVVLLSGESGAGKSTFLRLLKRGDINNRKAIQLDTGEMVDNLGNEYISFRPSINLGDETNVLYQITGKENISDLSAKEKKNLLTTLRQLKFQAPNLLEELASKKFMEFSTGQQRRLALSKVFYRIDDGTSVVIVDEPVGNVEDSLIREQLEMIKKYAESRNVMLILTTHRLDLAEDLATKRYHINKKGVLEQIPLKKKEKAEINQERD